MAIENKLADMSIAQLEKLLAEKRSALEPAKITVVDWRTVSDATIELRSAVRPIADASAGNGGGGVQSGALVQVVDGLNRRIANVSQRIEALEHNLKALLARIEGGQK